MLALHGGGAGRLRRPHTVVRLGGTVECEVVGQRVVGDRERCVGGSPRTSGMQENKILLRTEVIQMCHHIKQNWQ